MSRRIVVLCLTIALEFGGAGVVGATPRAPTGAPFVPGRVLVGVAPRTAAAVADAVRARGARPVELSATGRFLVVDVPGRVRDWTSVLSRIPGVRYAEPDFELQLMDTIPDDPGWPDLWGLQAIGTPAAWDVTTGSADIVVAVIDTGIDLTHPDLAGQLWTNPREIPGNGVDDDADGFVDDAHGADCVNHDGDPTDDDAHGTHVSGTIGAAGNDGAGLVGVNWHVSLMALKIFTANGSAPTSAIAQCIDYAIAHGARVSNNSYGGTSWSQTLYEAFARARNAGMLMAVAAGNSGWDSDVQPMYPAAFDLDNIVSVAASDHDDTLASFSNYGATSVDIAAPGVDILSTVPGGTAVFQGTSMAAPHVAGAAALLLSLYPAATYPWIRDALLSTVTPVPALSGLVTSGGRLNVAGAVAVLPSTGPPVATLPAPAIPVNRAAGATGLNVVLRWSARDVNRITAYELQRSTNNGASYAAVTLSPVTASTKTLWCSMETPSYRFRVRASDAIEGVGPWATGTAYRVRSIPETSPTVTYVGSWASASSSGALGGTVAYAGSAGASAAIAIPMGSQAFALVLPRAANRGRAEVWIDGSRRATLDLYNATTQDRWLAFGGTLDPNATHIVELRVLGLKRPVSSGTRVDLDGVILLGA